MSPHRQSLLLLSLPPSPPTYANVKAAYNATLLTVLKEEQRLAATASNGRRILDIALPCPQLYAAGGAPRVSTYSVTQTLLANLYKLITVISASQSVDVESSAGLDVRVLLVSFPRDAQSSDGAAGSPSGGIVGPVISIETLAASRRPWETVYAVQTEQGEEVLKAFLKVSKGQADVKRVRGGITPVSSSSSSPPTTAQSSTEEATAQRHHSVIVGGTFDHLHIGHKLLLTMFAFILEPAGGDDASSTEEQILTVGITAGEQLKNKKFAEHLESWEHRQRAVWEYLAGTMLFTQAGAEAVEAQVLNEAGPNGHAVHYHLPGRVVIKLVEIWDPFGPTVTVEAITALAISAETRSGGKAVNDRRREKGWPELAIFEVDVLDADEAADGGAGDEAAPGDEAAQGFHNKLSSTEIRRLESARRTAGSKV